MKLDKVDFSILKSLQKNGRITNVDLALAAGISPPPCLRRLKNLEQKGIIDGYHAKINNVAIGYNFHALCLISLQSQRKYDVNNFLYEVARLSSIRSCLSTLGEVDFILSVVAYDFKNFEHILTNQISKIANIAKIKTLTIMKTYKEEFGVPLPEEA